jgi:cyclomaltodextrinase
VTIHLGSYTTAATDHARQLYAFRRPLNKEDVLLVLNRGSQPATLSHAVLASRKYRDAFTQAATTKVTVPARDVVVLRAQ